MGERGPRPAPTALKVLRGERKDRINRDEPKPPEGRPACPRWLADEAKVVWRRLAPQLYARGKLLTDWDREQFAVYCEAWARWKENVVALRGESTVIEGHRGMVANPRIRSIAAAEATMKGLAREFGLTPSARSGIKVGGEPGGSKGAERFFG
jgi:P27 family predicted phage terminase small subunit